MPLAALQDPPRLICSITDRLKTGMDCVIAEMRREGGSESSVEEVARDGRSSTSMLRFSALLFAATRHAGSAFRTSLSRPAIFLHRMTLLHIANAALTALLGATREQTQ